MCWASLRQVALLKLGLIANLTLFPWKQPAGQLVPVNLRPGGASAPDRLLTNSVGGVGDLEALLEPSPAYCFPQELSVKGKSVNC